MSNLLNTQFLVNSFCICQYSNVKLSVLRFIFYDITVFECSSAILQGGAVLQYLAP